jgi:hypothetical protein
MREMREAIETHTFDAFRQRFARIARPGSTRTARRPCIRAACRPPVSRPVSQPVSRAATAVGRRFNQLSRRATAGRFVL